MDRTSSGTILWASGVQPKLIGLSLAVAGLLCGCAHGKFSRTEDSRITTDVKAQLAQHPALGPPNLIYVQTHHRVVYLSGSVNTGLTITSAAELARQVPGVSRVVSNIGIEQ
jgi:osmotically-inducible protein OsmY